MALRLSENYADAIALAGGLPIVAPLTEDHGVYDELLDTVDGLMLTGGADVDPTLYRDALSLSPAALAEGRRSSKIPRRNATRQTSTCLPAQRRAAFPSWGSATLADHERRSWRYALPRYSRPGSRGIWSRGHCA